VQERAASFIAHIQVRSGAELPWFIKDEFDGFLECAPWRLVSCGCVVASAATIQ